MPHLAAVALAGAIVAALYAAPLPVRDIDRRTWTPLAPRAGQLHVLFFVMTDCPNSNAYAPEIGRIAAEYRRRRVQPFLVYVDGSVTSEDARRHFASYYKDVPIPVIVDAALGLVEATGVQIAPEVAIYTAAGRVYRGRINNLYVDIGRRRRQPTEHDVRNALEALLAGRPVPRAETQAVGCYIERPTP